MSFTKKQRMFINEYLKSFNATQAALKAGYSKHSLSEIGYENLRKPHIKEEIDRRIAEGTMSADECLMRLSEQARSEGANYLTPDGCIDIERLLADGKGHLIKRIKLWRSEDGQITRQDVMFYDAQAALIQIGRAYGSFTDNVDVQSGGKPILFTGNVAKLDGGDGE